MSRKKGVKTIVGLVTVGFVLLLMGFLFMTYTIPEISPEEIKRQKEVLRRVREQYAKAAGRFGCGGPERQRLEAECARLEQLESELTSSPTQPFVDLGIPTFAMGIMLLGAGFAKILIVSRGAKSSTKRDSSN